MTSHHPRWFDSIRSLARALLVGLILAAGTSNVVLPAMADASIDAPEPAEPIESPVGDYCRTRRDGVAELRLVLVAGVPRPAESRPSARSASLRFPPRPLLAVKTEHRSYLSRRSRSPGLHVG